MHESWAYATKIPKAHDLLCRDSRWCLHICIMQTDRPNDQTGWANERTTNQPNERINAHAIAKIPMYQIICAIGGLWIDPPNGQNYAWKWSTDQTKPNQTRLNDINIWPLISIGECFVSKVICVNLQKRRTEHRYIDKTSFCERESTVCVCVCVCMG